MSLSNFMVRSQQLSKFPWLIILTLVTSHPFVLARKRDFAENRIRVDVFAICAYVFGKNSFNLKKRQQKCV